MYMVCISSNFPWSCLQLPQTSRKFLKLPMMLFTDGDFCPSFHLFFSVGWLNLLIPDKDRCHKEKIFFWCDRKNLVSQCRLQRRRWRCGLSVCRYTCSIEDFWKHYVYHWCSRAHTHVTIWKLLLPYFSDTGNYYLCSRHVYVRILLKPFSLDVNVQNDCISLGSYYNINF